jgi:hypothetical protein
VEALPCVPIVDRSSVIASDDSKVAQAITATDRKKLIFAGIIAVSRRINRGGRPQSLSLFRRAASQ